MAVFQWTCKNCVFHIGRRTLLMGVVNVTPDSFSDGGEFFDCKKAVDHASTLIEEGADLIDIGGASSRPGAEPVSIDEELKRVLPVVDALARRGYNNLSIDTCWSQVARPCIEAGASVINDITGLRSDPELARLAAESGAGLIIMHMRGNPRTMQSLTEYQDLLNDIRSYFVERIDVARSAGVKQRQIAIDPGIGFSKTADQNLRIIHNLKKIRVDDYPMVLGVSRKSFIGAITHREASKRSMGTAGAVAACILYGADIVRVHEVGAMREVAAVVDAIRRERVTE